MWREHKTPIAIGSALFVLAAIAFRVLRRDAGYWTIDDAGITYAAALQLVDHGSLATSFEGTPIEGYSNPLVFFVVALLRVFGLFDPITTHLVLEMLLFATMVVIVWSMLRTHGEIAALAGAVIFTIVELATPATWIWYGSGLENVWVSTGLVAMLWLCLRTARGVPLSHRWGTLLFAVALTRPEAPVYVAACFVALATVAATDRRAHLVRVLRVAIVTGALGIAFVAWRRIAYGDWLPNTYYAKMHERHLGANLAYVGEVLRYGRSGLFAAAALVMIAVRWRVGLVLVLFAIASLALPIAAGADWMGEHRFATPFLAMAHAAYAMLVAWCVGQIVVRRRVFVLALLAIGVVPALLFKIDRNTLRNRFRLNEVTVGHIAYLEGALRWEEQMRLGLPYPVVLMPDAGGSMLVGGAQQVDNGLLTDFQIARMGRDYQKPSDQAELEQYQAERDPDLLTVDLNFNFDRGALGTRYVLPPGGYDAPQSPTTSVLAVRRDLVEAGGDGTPMAEGVRLSPETVTSAGPGGLVRIELFVPSGSGTLRATIAGDRDELVLRPESTRVGLLVGAPRQVGTYEVALSLDGRPIGSVPIEVTERPPVTTDADPWRAARRLAWSYEQRVPRLSMTAYRAVRERLVFADRAHAAEVGALIVTLRSNARLATKQVDGTLATRLFGPCGEDIVCVGRTVDRLRRLGFLDTARLARAAIERARAALKTARGDARYRILVGLALAQPGDIRLQRALLAARSALKTTGFPPL